MKKLIFLAVCIIFCFIEFYRIAFTQNIANLFAYLFNSQLFLQSNSHSFFHIVSNSIDTLIYSFIHTVLTVSIIYLYFKNIKYTIYTIIFVLFLLLSCLLSFFLHKITNIPFFYRCTEDLIYTTLSPTPLLILFGFLGLVLPMSNKMIAKK